MESTSQTGIVPDDKLDERCLYHGLICGDRDAWYDFYTYFRDRLLAYFKSKNVYLKEDREDLFSETMVAFWSSLERYDPDRCPLKNWVFGIAKKVMVDRQRKYSAEYDHETSWDDRGYEIPDSGKQHPDDHDGIADPLLQKLQSALENLSKIDRQILKLRNERDLALTTWNDIAEELGIGTSAAKMRHTRALQKLREALFDGSA